MKNNKLKLAVAAALLIPALAIAKGYGNNRGYHHGYNHSYHRGHNHNWVAPTIGAVILGGVIGAALSRPQPPVYIAPSYRYETVYVPSCNCYQTVLVPN